MHNPAVSPVPAAAGDATSAQLAVSLPKSRSAHNHQHQHYQRLVPQSVHPAAPVPILPIHPHPSILSRRGFHTNKRPRQDSFSSCASMNATITTTTTSTNNNNSSSNNNNNSVKPSTASNNPTTKTTTAATTSTSTSRRRSPTLERLPRWLFPPVRCFLSPASCVPLPRRVAVCGKPFYDWDAWALSLFHDRRLWARQGPWETLIRSVHACKPQHPSPPLQSIKAFLVRIVVAEVVSMLVGRSGDALTSEDRNWITSVASRQRGHVKKPTLMLLLDFAFPLFDIVGNYRMPMSMRPPIEISPPVSSRTCPISPQVVTVHQRIVAALNELHSEKNRSIQQSYTSHTDGEVQTNKTLHIFQKHRNENSLITQDPVVELIMNILQRENPIASTNKQQQQQQRTLSSLSSETDRIRPVSVALQLIVNNNDTSAQISECSKTAQVQPSSIHRAALSFVHALPPLDHSSTLLPNDHKRLSSWIRQALSYVHWAAWAQLAYDFKFITLPFSEDVTRRANCQAQLCRLIVNIVLERDEAEVAGQADQQSCGSSAETSGDASGPGGGSSPRQAAIDATSTLHNHEDNYSTRVSKKQKTGHNITVNDDVNDNDNKKEHLQIHSSGRHIISYVEHTIQVILNVAIAFDAFLSAYADENGCDIKPMKPPAPSTTSYSYGEDMHQDNDNSVRKSSFGTGHGIARAVEAYESLVQALKIWRDVLLATGERREIAMIGWCECSMKYAEFYKHRSLPVIGGRMAAHDVERAVLTACADASWTLVTQNRRLTDLQQCEKNDAKGSSSSLSLLQLKDVQVHTPDTDAEIESAPESGMKEQKEKVNAFEDDMDYDKNNGGSKKTDGTSNDKKNRFPYKSTAYPWVHDLNLQDTLSRAIAVAPFDPKLAMLLIDRGIAMDDERRARILAGHEGCLPLTEMRRVDLFRHLASSRPSSMILPTPDRALERLQAAFDVEQLHDGGNFSRHSIALLTYAIQEEGNICAMTTLGLLYAGEGEFWHVARYWACSPYAPAHGMSMLFSAALRGDVQACTAFAHICACRAERESEELKNPNRNRHNDNDVNKHNDLEGITYEHLISLFNMAVLSSNADAVLNFGALWNRGLRGILQPDRRVALDCFLIALQGSRTKTTRDMAIAHLLSCYQNDRDVAMVQLLNSLLNDGDEHREIHEERASQNASSGR